MKLIAGLAAVAATPAFAAEGPFVSMANTDFVVFLAFLIFVGILIYARVPARITGMLDARAAAISADLAEARALREEARAIYASFERKQAEVQEQSARIVANARQEAMTAAAAAREELKSTIARKVNAAEEQIAAAEAGAVRAVRDQAVTVAIASASDLIKAQMTAAQGNALIEAAISDVRARLN